MVDIAASFCMPTLFIRYNPDKYNGLQESKNARHKTLVTTVNSYLRREECIDVNEFGIAMIYLYYDGWDGVVKQI